VEEKAPDRGEGRSEEVMATMDLKLGLPAVHVGARGGSGGEAGERGGAPEERDEGREGAVGMQKDLDIPGMQHGQVTSANCRTCCGNC
jgi:hypothetical protein